uniref:Nucleoporin NUP42 n=1 Tax=Steinernema glaseri TaxID=37863 RepID=A0A1I8ADH6_9BILA
MLHRDAGCRSPTWSFAMGENNNATATSTAAILPETLQAPPTLIVSVEEAKVKKKNHSRKKAAVCHFFLAGKCERRKCRFLHDNQVKAVASGNDGQVSTNTSSAPPPNTQKRQKIKTSVPCRYFLTEGCRKGKSCRFVHDASDSAPPEARSNSMNQSAVAGSSVFPTDQEQKPQVIVPRTVAPGRIAVRPKKETCSAADKGTAPQLQIRRADLHYFRRRYASAKLSEHDFGTEITFTYEITHPDWVFDVKELDFKLVIAKDHPYVAPEIEVLRTAMLPEVLCNHINSELNERIARKMSTFVSEDKYENLSKWLVRILDCHIFDMFVTGLKKTKMILEAESSGIKIVQLPTVKYDEEENQQQVQGTIIPPSKKKEGEQGKKPDEREDENVFQTSNASSRSEQEDEDERRDVPSAIKLRLAWNDNTGNIGTMKALSVLLAVKCLKCSAVEYLECKEGVKKQNRCAQCKVGQSVMYYSELVHHQSDLLGYFHFKGCRPLECVLMDSRFRASCLNCSREFDVVNLSNAVVNKNWCHDCHTKCEFAIFTSRFSGNFELILREDNTVARSTKKKKAELGPAIVVGQPLPENGTCKHYKKSYRWLRFPCCGKTFPCDVCHEEAGMGHEMKFATRMICGSCSHEQPFSKDKPCVSCKQTTTKSKSSHWEGGRGCREKLFMSRNDDRKYKNSSLKTVPKNRTGPSKN